MTQAPELKPCPFCGRHVQISSSGDLRWIKCLGEAGCKGSGLHTCFTSADTETAASAWNTRATPTTAECLRNEKVRALIEAVKQRCCDRCLDGDVEAALAALEQEAGRE